MKLEEYKTRAEREDWAPGWDAIDEVFKKIYPNQEPAHYGTNIVQRAILGGDEYLDGFSIYQSQNDYKHIVTYGMTELYVNEEAFGGEWSRWGYEMTIKLKEESIEGCLWAIDLLSNLARYTYKQHKFFEPMQYVSGNGTSINRDVESEITALLVVSDTEAEEIETVHGRVEFNQMIGITQKELEAIKEDHLQAQVLIEKMKKDNPYLVTDMKRTYSYL